MDTKIENGGFVMNSRGIPETVSGLEEVLQQIKIALTINKGSYRYNRNLGSRIKEIDLSYEHAEDRLKMTANEALVDSPGIEIIDAIIGDGYVDFTAATYLGQGNVRIEI